MLSSNQKGLIAETAITYAATEFGVGVARPIGDEPYDLIFDLRPRLIRVQCKWAARQGDVVVIRCCRARRNADGLLRQYYSRADVDYFAAYCQEIRTCYLLAFDEIPPGAIVQLRLTPTRNNQERGIRWAESFEIGARLRRLGAIAQLGERVAGSDEVGGSSPPGSIGSRPV